MHNQRALNNSVYLINNKYTGVIMGQFSVMLTFRVQLITSCLTA